MILSERLEAIASFVTRGYRLADIGTDHGFIPVKLVSEGTVPCAIALDLREGPLERAREHIREAALTEKISTRISDGLSALKPGEADSVLIAGMGGDLLIRILQESLDACSPEYGDFRSSVKEWILSPHTEWKAVREFLDGNGFRILKEGMAEEDGKYYLILKVTAFPGIETQDFYGDAEKKGISGEACYCFGPELILRKDPVLFRYLTKEKSVYEGLLNRIPGEGERNVKRHGEIVHYLDLIREAMSS